MSNKPLSDRVIEQVREGMGIWRAVQLQAGAPECSTVAIGGTKAPMHDLEGMVSAFLQALPERDPREGKGEWWARAGARVGLVRDHESGQEIIGTALFASRHVEDDMTIQEPGGRLLTRVEVKDGEPSPWFDPLDSAAKYADRCGDDLIAFAGTMAAIWGAGGVRWSSRLDGESIMGMVALPRIVWAGTDEDSLLKRLMHTGDHLWMGLSYWTTSPFSLGDSPQEAAEKLLDRDGRLFAAASHLEAFAGDWRALDTIAPADLRSRDLSFVVPGFLPSGEVTLLAGNAGSGKSTTMTDLARLVATPLEQRDEADSFWSVPARELAHGTAVLLSGEDGEPILRVRLEQILDGRPQPTALIESHWRGQSLQALTAALEKITDLRLVVVDPALVFLGGGDEKESDVVDAFINGWRRLAVKKDCAVVIVHHLKKSAKPGHPKNVVDLGYIRGSQAWVDRPRSVIGCVRRTGATVLVGVAKHNVPPSYPMTEVVTLQRDDRTLRLVASGGGAAAGANDAAAGKPTKTDALMEAVVSAVAEVHAAGRFVYRRGKRSLYALGLPGLQAVGRQKMVGVMNAAVAAGHLRALPDGRVVPAQTLSTPCPIGADTAGHDIEKTPILSDVSVSVSH